MSAFLGSLAGAGLGAIGSVIGGSSAGKAQQRSIQLQEKQSDINNQQVLRYLQAALLGDIPLDSLLGGQANRTPDDPALQSWINVLGQQRDRLLAQPDSAGKAKALQDLENNLQWATAQAYRRNPPQLGAVGIPGLVEAYKRESERQRGAYDAATGGFDAGGAKTREQLLANAAALRDAANTFGPRATAAATAAHDRSLAEGKAGIVRQFQRQGISGGSTEANAEIALRSRAAPGLAQALADIERASTGFKVGAEDSIMRLLSGFDVSENDRSRGTALGRFGIDQSFGNLSLDAIRGGNQAVLGLVNPGQAYQTAQYPSSVGGQTGQAIGGLLSGFGGNLYGGSLQSLFENAVGSSTGGGGGGGGSGPTQTTPNGGYLNFFNPPPVRLGG